LLLLLPLEHRLGEFVPKHPINHLFSLRLPALLLLLLLSLALELRAHACPSTSSIICSRYLCQFCNRAATVA